MNLLPFFFIGVAIAWWDVSLVQNKEVIEHGLGGLDRLIVASRALCFYPRKILVPIDLVAVYPKWEIQPFSITHMVWPMTVLLVFGILVWRAHKGRAAGLLLFLAYCFLSGPTLGFVDFGFMALSFVADRFAYLACIPVFIAIVFGFRTLMERSGREWTWRMIATLLLLVLAALSAYQCRVYENQETLVRHNLEKYPEAWIVRYNFAIDLASLERYDEAVAQYERVLEDRPDFLDARNNLGILWVKQGELDRAVDQFRRILEVDPENVRTLQNLGVVAARAGNRAGALEWYRRALAIEPENETFKKAVASLSPATSEVAPGE